MEIDVLTGPSTRELQSGRFTVFDSAAAPADEALIGRLGEGTEGTDLAAPPVVLPDFCHKSKSEMPSSIAVATRIRRTAGSSPKALAGSKSTAASATARRRSASTA